MNQTTKDKILTAASDLKILSDMLTDLDSAREHLHNVQYQGPHVMCGGFGSIGLPMEVDEFCVETRRNIAKAISELAATLHKDVCADSPVPFEG